MGGLCGGARPHGRPLQARGRYHSQVSDQAEGEEAVSGHSDRHGLRHRPLRRPLSPVRDRRAGDRREGRHERHPAISMMRYIMNRDRRGALVVTAAALALLLPACATAPKPEGRVQTWSYVETRLPPYWWAALVDVGGARGRGATGAERRIAILDTGV